MSNIEQIFGMLLLRIIFKLYIVHSKNFFYFNRISYWNITDDYFSNFRIDIV